MPGVVAVLDIGKTNVKRSCSARRGISLGALEAEPRAAGASLGAYRAHWSDAVG